MKSVLSHLQKFETQVLLCVVIAAALLVGLAYKQELTTHSNNGSVVGVYGVSEPEGNIQSPAFWALRPQVIVKIVGRTRVLLSISSSPCGGSPAFEVNSAAGQPPISTSANQYLIDNRYASEVEQVLLISADAQACRITTDPRTFYFRLTFSPS